MKNRHISFMCDFSYEFICLFLAVICSGNIAIPINPNLNRQELKDKLCYADVTHIILDSKYSRLIPKKDTIQSIDHIIETKTIYLNTKLSKIVTYYNTTLKPNSCATMFFTSGTTGNSLHANAMPMAFFAIAVGK